MSLNSNEDVSVKRAVLSGLKGFCKICFVVIAVWFFAVASLTVLFPRASAKLYNFFGLKKAEENSLNRIYEKSQNLSDLYNLVIFESSSSNFEQELKYLNILISAENFDDFANKLDSSSITSTTNKSLIPYIANVKSYLANQKLNCLIKLNESKENALTFVYSSLAGEYLNEYTFTTFVEWLKSSNLTSAEKGSEITKFLEMFDSSGKTTDELLKERLSNLKIKVDSETNLNLKIIESHAHMTLCRGRLDAYIMANKNESEISEARAAYTDSLQAYSSLI
ncbi:MAG: hypothetical protein IJ538_04600 [Clostridia bacterium]|nr:hypothetical protein [Clostridia bacterium]